MSTRRRAAVLVACAAAVAVPVAFAQDDEGLGQPAPRSVNLDGDPELERVISLVTKCYSESGDSPPPCAEDAARDVTVAIEDTCGGATRQIRLIRPQSVGVDFDVRDFDGEKSRLEVLAEGRSGASGRGGDAAVVRMGADGCAKPRVLYRHPSRLFPGTRKPKGASYAADGFVTARNFDKRRRGRELRVEQMWYRTNDAGCCPSFVGVAYLRYDAAKDRYVRYKTHTRRLPRPD